MKAFSKVVMVFCTIQIFLLAAGFLITRAVLKARGKVLLPDDEPLFTPVHWLSSFVAAYGPWLLTLPLIWYLGSLWWGRLHSEEAPSPEFLFKSGMTATISLGILAALSTIYALQSLQMSPTRMFIAH